MAEQFDISKHIKVQALGARQGVLQVPYNIFTVNGKEYNPNDYDISYIPTGPATPLVPIRPTDFTTETSDDIKIIPFELGVGRYHLTWRPQADVSSYRVYRWSEANPTYSLIANLPSTQNWYQVIQTLNPRLYIYRVEIDYVGGGSSEYVLPVQTADIVGIEGHRDWQNRVEFTPSSSNGGILKFGGTLPNTNASISYMLNEDFGAGITPHPDDRYLINVVPNGVSYPDYSVPVSFVYDSPNSLDYRHLVVGVYEVSIGGLNLDTEPGYKFVVNLERADGQVYEIGSYVYGQEPPNEVESTDIIANGWWDIECSVAQCEIDAGYNIEKGLLKTGEPGTASITLKGSEGNPTSNTALSLDSKILIKLDAAASPDGTEDYLFSGYIESWSTSYDPFGNAITDIQCVDGLSKALNVNIPLYQYASEESFSTRMFNLFNDYLGPATSGTSGAVAYDINTLWPLLQPYDGSVFPPEYRENVSASEIINELTEGEYGVIAQNRGGVIFWFNRASGGLFYDPSLIAATPSFGFSTTHDPDSLDHHCVTDFTIRNSLDDITNKVVASLSYDELTTADYEDATSIAQYGERAYEVQLNLYAPSGNQTQYLDSWLAAVPYSEDQPEIESVATNVVNRNGLVTRAYLYDITFDPVRVFIQTGPVDFNGVLFAKRIRHSIDPENWTMTLDLTAD